MRIVIAGGVGSGKSAVTKILRDLGAKVVVADEVNSELLKEPEYVCLIENTFPTVVHNKVINKKELAALVYRDEEKRRTLMDLAHPRIFDRMLAAYPHESLVFYEIPLLSKSNIRFDQIWFVCADPAVRVARIMNRDGVSKERAERVLLLQREEESFLTRADVVIKNDGNLDALCENVKTLYYSILNQNS